MSEVERLFDAIMGWGNPPDPNDKGKYPPTFGECVEALIEAARAEGVQDGLEKAANMLDLKLTDFDGEWYFEEAARRVRSLTEAPKTEKCETCKGRAVFIATDVPGRAAPLLKKSVCPTCNGTGVKAETGEARG